MSKKSNNDAARRMTTRRDQVALQAAAERTAQRLQIDTAEPGMRMGRSVTTGRRVYAPWEYLHLTIAGPGRHKSVAQVIPAILSAPGACVASSNKNDIVTLTRLARSYKGNTWVFDPQQIAEEPPTWWWNPLRQIRTLSHAEELMSTLVDASKDAEAKARADGFFDPKGQQLLSWCLLAAAMDGQQLSNVYLWLSDSQNSEPDEILREHGATVAATGIEAMRRLPEKTRESIFATAEIFVRWLTNDEITRWVTCSAGGAGHAPGVPPGRVRPVHRHDLPAVAQGRRFGGAADHGAFGGDPHHRRPHLGEVARRPPQPAAARGTRRGRQHLPLEPAARPLHPLPVEGHHRDGLAAVVGAGRGHVRRVRHEDPVGRGRLQDVRRRLLRHGRSAQEGLGPGRPVGRPADDPQQRLPLVHRQPVDVRDHPP
ncbi:hypothetical protein GCM10020000_35840 [Streptomyces olivoverticillatus]